MKNYASMVAAALFTLAAVGNAQANTYYLNLSNMSAFPDGTNYIKVDVTKPTTTEIQFTVTPQSPISSALLMGFGFNTTGTSTSTSQIMAPSGWSVSGSGREDGFGTFQFNLSADQGNNNRVSPLTFDITGLSAAVTPLNFFANSTGAAGEQNVPFVAHVANLGNGLTGYFGGPAPVPVPAAVWLFGSGLVGLVGVARRRSRV
ncbi:MAG: VPLPA-CTERM sorting domain-containing protein [Gammaproteobacteria bacterium]|jgi:hypothetical protein